MAASSRTFTEKAAILILVVSSTFVAQDLVTGAETCSGRGCVGFDQWKVGTSGSDCYEAPGAELWSFANACCHPTPNPDWCVTSSSLTNMGSSTLVKMSSCTLECTASSCGSTKPQLASSSMAVENCTATRYECAGFGG